MKKLRILMSLVVAFTGCFTSISAQKTFRVFKHDGSLNVFLYSNIDSITYSNMDENGMLQDYVVTQNIHTSDSVYRFNVNEIDSVAFTQLPTVYKPDAIRIEGRLRDYVVGADSLTLFLKKSIPESLLPKPGDNLATLECDDVLPYGFFGKVERITQAAETINVECTQAALTDIYESLELVISTDGDGKAKSRSPENENPNHYSFTIPTLRKDKDFKKEIEAAGGLSGTYNMNAFVELSTEKCDVISVLNIVPDFPRSPKVYWDFYYEAQNTLRIGASLSSTVTWDKEIPIKTIRNIRAKGWLALIELYLEGGFFINIEGKVGLSGSYSKPFTTKIKYTRNPDAEVAATPIFEMKGLDSKVEATAEGGASITLGLYGKIGVGAGAKEIANLEAGFRIGTKYSSSISLMPAATPIEVLNTEMYDEMDRDDFFRGDLILTGKLSAGVLNEEKKSKKLDFTDMVFKNPFFTSGVVPHFDEVTLTESEKAGTLTAGATLSRELMFDTPVGFALYDSDKKFVDSWWSPTDYKDKEGEKISHDFENLKSNEEYTVHPITRAMKDNMVANPPSTAKITPTVSTDKAGDISSCAVTLHGKINCGVGDDGYCGFYFGTDLNHLDSQIATLNSNGEFEVRVSSLKPSTEYKYRAYCRIGSNIYYGDIKEFKTKATIESEGLEYFYQSTNGNNWFNNTGWLKDSNVDSWYGIVNRGDGCYDINLADNNLTGDGVLNKCKVKSIDISGNPIKSLTLEACDDLHKIKMPGKDESLIFRNHKCKWYTNIESATGKLNKLTISDINHSVSYNDYHGETTINEVILENNLNAEIVLRFPLINSFTCNNIYPRKNEDGYIFCNTIESPVNTMTVNGEKAYFIFDKEVDKIHVSNCSAVHLYFTDLSYVGEIVITNCHFTNGNELVVTERRYMGSGLINFRLNNSVFTLRCHRVKYIEGDRNLIESEDYVNVDFEYNSYYGTANALMDDIREKKKDYKKNHPEWDEIEFYW